MPSPDPRSKSVPCTGARLVPTGQEFAPSRSSLLGLWAVIAAGLISRPATTSVGPVLNELNSALDLSPTVAGVLTALPGISFAVVGLMAAKLPVRFGLLPSLIGASALMVAGMLLRVAVGSWQLFLLFSFVALAGMAVANVLVPMFIKADFPRRTARVTAAFTTFLAVGQLLPTLFTTPVAGAASNLFGADAGWRFALGVWSVLAVLSLGAWVAVAKRDAGDRAAPLDAPVVPRRAVRSGLLWRSPAAVALMVFFGLQAMHAYLQYGWLPLIYRAGGLAPVPAALMVTIISVGGIIAGMVMPTVVARGKYLRPIVVVISALSATGYVGIALAPTTLPWLWACALSLAGFAFATSLALVIARTRSPLVTVAVSGFVQPYGYFFAALGPLLVGVLYQALGNWQPILFGLAASSVALCASGWVAVGPRLIDDELPAGKLPEGNTNEPLE